MTGNSSRGPATRRSRPVAAFWENRYGKLIEDFHGRFGEDIIEAFRSLQDRGQIEVLTSAATHGYLPLLSRDESIRQQVRQGRHAYRKYFGREPRGFWVPECAYRPGYAWSNPLTGEGPAARAGIDEILAQEGLGLFLRRRPPPQGRRGQGGLHRPVSRAQAALGEVPGRLSRPARMLPHDPYTPHLAHPSRLPFFARDEVSGSQVWSRHMGYPGDGAYLEFHKKHFPGGMRYWRITSGEADLGLKEPYEPDRTAARAEEHAAHFVSVLARTLEDRSSGAVAALYDTELFGHWWFEGPEWLYHVVRKLAAGPVGPVTAGGALEALPPTTVVSLPEGSWGQGGFHGIWLNDDTAWIWTKIYRIEKAAAALEARLAGLDRRILKQFYREKYLLESSDWPFLISTWSARDYAEHRAAEHFERALTLAGWLEEGRRLGPAEEALLAAFESEDRIFEEVVLPDGNVI